MHKRLSHLALLFSPLIAVSCLPGSGSIKIVGDSGLGLDGAIVADGAPAPEMRIVTPDTGGSGKLDTGGSGKLDTGGKPKLDTKPTPKPDAKVACPAPPFGTSKGMSAGNFVNIPDCKGVQYTLHPLCGKHKAIVMAMMSPS